MELFAAFILTLFFKFRSRHIGAIALASISCAWLTIVAISTALVYWYAEPLAVNTLNKDVLLPLMAQAVGGVIAGLVAPKIWPRLPEKIRGAL